MAKLQVAIWNKGSVQTFDIPDDIPNKEAEAKKHVDTYIEKLLKDIKVEWHVDYQQRRNYYCSKPFKIENLDDAMLFLNSVDETFDETKNKPNFIPNEHKEKIVYRAKEIYYKKHPDWTWEECINYALLESESDLDES